MPPRDPVPKPNVRAQYFAVTARVTEEIEAWRAKKGARIVSIIPVYWEDAPNDQA